MVTAMAITSLKLNRDQLELVSRKLVMRPDESAILWKIPEGARITKFPSVGEMLFNDSITIEYETKDDLSAATVDIGVADE